MVLFALSRKKGTKNPFPGRCLNPVTLNDMHSLPSRAGDHDSGVFFVPGEIFADADVEGDFLLRTRRVDEMTHALFDDDHADVGAVHSGAGVGDGDDVSGLEQRLGRRDFILGQIPLGELRKVGFLLQKGVQQARIRLELAVHVEVGTHKVDLLYERL